MVIIENGNDSYIIDGEGKDLILSKADSPVSYVGTHGEKFCITGFHFVGARGSFSNKLRTLRYVVKFIFGIKDNRIVTY